MKGRLAALFLSLFILAMGIGQIALTPPFEGLDEIGHYSSIRQVATEWVIPTTENAYFDKSATEHRGRATFPYSAVPPFEANKGLTYPQFFRNKALVEAYPARFRAPEGNVPYERSAEQNWQAQHPPLYYLLMGPIAAATQGLSFTGQFFVLRFVSYLLALGGLFAGLWGTLRFMRAGWEKLPIFLPTLAGAPSEDPALWPKANAFFAPPARQMVFLSFMLYPILFPQFFPEFARLGNDSLCVLISGLFWAVLLKWLEDERNAKLTVALGALLGLGLWTKAFFLAITFGFGLFLLLRLWAARKDRDLLDLRANNLVLMAAPVVLGLYWYVYKWKSTGNFVGAPEYEMIKEKGGLLLSLTRKGALKEFGHELYGLFGGFVWGGAASQLRSDIRFHYPLLAPMILPAVLYLVQLRRIPPASFAWAPFWLVGPFFAALVQHLLIYLSFPKLGGTPGWYLHILAPVLAYAFAIGWGAVRFRGFFLALMSSYGLLFLLVITWVQMTLVTGLSAQLATKAPYFYFAPLSLPRWEQVIERLSVLAWPWAGIGCTALALLFLAVGLWFFYQDVNQSAPQGRKN